MLLTLACSLLPAQSCLLTPTLTLHSLPAVYLAISIPPLFHATNHTVQAWLLALAPRYGGLSATWQRFIVNCVTILPCLAIALGVPGESGTVLSVTGATGGWVGGWVGGMGWGSGLRSVELCKVAAGGRGLHV